MNTLYEIDNDILMLLEQHCDEDGSLPPDVEARLDELGMAREAKIDNILRFVRCKEASAAVWSAQAEQFEAEQKRLSTLARADAAKAARLKEYVKQSMERQGIKKIETEHFIPRVQANGGRPVIRLKPGAEIPPRYAKMVVEFDTAAVYQDLKAGLTIPAEVEVVRGSHLHIQ